MKQRKGNIKDKTSEINKKKRYQRYHKKFQ